MKYLRKLKTDSESVNRSEIDVLYRWKRFGIDFKPTFEQVWPNRFQIDLKQGVSQIL